MTPEGRLMREIMLAASKAGARLQRMNAGVAWTGGPITRNADGSVTIKNARPFHGVVRGVSDLCGWDATGRFVAIEVKTPTGRVTKDQLAFIEAVRRSGGRAGVARTVPDALAILTAPPSE